MPFNDIRSALRLNKRDNRFLLGDFVMKSLGGWPMGASLSEPCTMCDINRDVFRCSTSRSKARKCGWMTPQVPLPFEKIVTGVLHVDDMAVFSKIWCQDCIAAKIKRSFPADIGLQVEEEGPTLRILSVIVDIDVDSKLHIFPNNPDVWYGLGLEAEQQRLRLGPFYSRSIQSHKVFLQYFVGQLLMYDRLVAGRLEHMHIHICALIHEVLRLGWPQHYVSNAMQSIPRRHRSPLVQHIRFMGRSMRRRSFQDIACL